MDKIIEGNRLIAEFMGLISKPPGKKYCLEQWYIANKDKRKSPRFLAYSDSLEYHSSWDWLMPVVEKISKITIEWENYDNRDETYYPRTFGMINSETGDMMVRINGQILHQAKTLIEATHSAVVEFIKWYNTQNK